MFTRVALMLSPQWRALSAEQRERAWRECVYPLLRLWSWLLASAALLTGVLLLVITYAPGSRPVLWFFAVVLLGREVLDILWIVVRWRTVRDFLRLPH